MHVGLEEIEGTDVVKVNTEIPGSLCKPQMTALASSESKFHVAQASGLRLCHCWLVKHSFGNVPFLSNVEVHDFGNVLFLSNGCRILGVLLMHIG